MDRAEASRHRHLDAEIRAWRAAYRKPTTFTECRAEAFAGLHGVTPTSWTEEYQAAHVLSLRWRGAR